MAKRKLGGLGKGLDSLFEDLPLTEDASPDLTRLPVREIEPDPDQPRKNFDEDAMTALAESIGENGLLQPIAVRAKKTGPGYVIIAGERRWRAARMAGLDEVPVLIKDVTDEQAAALALIENLQREDLDPIEVAEGCKKLIERYGLTQEEAAKRLGKSRSAITNAMRLLNLPEYVRDQVRTGDISAASLSTSIVGSLVGGVLSTVVMMFATHSLAVAGVTGVITVVFTFTLMQAAISEYKKRHQELENAPEETDEQK